MGLLGKKKPKYEYKTVKVSGTIRTGGGWSKKQQKVMNKMAKKGWEYVDSEEMGRGKNNRKFWTSSIIHSTRYVVMRFR